MQFKLLQVSRKTIALSGIMMLGVALSGCAGTDVELNIPGMKGVTLGGKPVEKQVAVRSGLVIPPSTQKLPDPNQVAAKSESEGQAWPDDPDERNKKMAALKKKEAQNKREGLDKDGNPDFEAMHDGYKGPGLIEKIRSGELFGNKEEE